MNSLLRISALLILAALAGCSSTPTRTASHAIHRKPATSTVTLQDASRRNDVVMYAFGLINVDYRFGGANPESGLDCSGMVSYIYKNSVGLKLPHNAAQIAGVGKEISRSDLQPGDLVFFNTMKRAFSHVGIYVGEGKFIHSPKPGAQVRVEDMGQNYWQQRFNGARRVLSQAPRETASTQP